MGARKNREGEFVQSLRDWGEVFMLTIWAQSIMCHAIAEKTATGGVTAIERRDELMKKSISEHWKELQLTFPGPVSRKE